MASKFMKIKRIIIPMMTLIIMTSQLAGCATMSSNEMLETMQESPDVSIEYAIPDPGQQSLDATQVIDVDGEQIVTDTSDDTEIGLMADEEQQELSGDELIQYFQLAYGTSDGISYLTTTDEKIDFEIEVLGIRADNEGQKLPADYADQYRAWRPVEEEPAEVSTPQQVSDESKNQTQTQNQNQGQENAQQQQTQSQQNQGTAQPAQPSASDDSYDPYRGYGSYEAYIDHICKELPNVSREEIIRRNPDPATGEAGPATDDNIRDNPLSGN